MRRRATGDATMTCRIDRLAIERGVVLRISGRITGEDLEVLRTALGESSVVASISRRSSWSTVMR